MGVIFRCGKSGNKTLLWVLFFVLVGPLHSDPLEQKGSGGVTTLEDTVVKESETSAGIPPDHQPLEEEDESGEEHFSESLFRVLYDSSTQTSYVLRLRHKSKKSASGQKAHHQKYLVVEAFDKHDRLSSLFHGGHPLLLPLQGHDFPFLKRLEQLHGSHVNVVSASLFPEGGGLLLGLEVTYFCGNSLKNALFPVLLNSQGHLEELLPTSKDAPFSRGFEPETPGERPFLPGLESFSRPEPTDHTVAFARRMLVDRQADAFYFAYHYPLYHLEEKKHVTVIEIQRVLASGEVDGHFECFIVLPQNYKNKSISNLVLSDWSQRGENEFVLLGNYFDGVLGTIVHFQIPFDRRGKILSSPSQPIGLPAQQVPHALSALSASMEQSQEERVLDVGKHHSSRFLLSARFDSFENKQGERWPMEVQIALAPLKAHDLPLSVSANVSWVGPHQTHLYQGRLQVTRGEITQFDATASGGLIEAQLKYSLQFFWQGDLYFVSFFVQYKRESEKEEFPSPFILKTTLEKRPSSLSGAHLSPFSPNGLTHSHGMVLLSSQINALGSPEGLLKSATEPVFFNESSQMAWTIESEPVFLETLSPLLWQGPMESKVSRHETAVRRAMPLVTTSTLVGEWQIAPRHGLQYHVLDIPPSISLYSKNPLRYSMVQSEGSLMPMVYLRGAQGVEEVVYHEVKQPTGRPWVARSAVLQLSAPQFGECPRALLELLKE